jgi:transcriptional regulator with GAF, ATPase, and Fis domain
LLTTGETLQLDLPPLRRPRPEPESDDWPDMDELQRRYIRAVLEKTGGKIGGPDGAAEILGMKRATLYARMGKLGLR